ncbi:phage holin family protein [Uliginosibacterium sp. sgz301328]|uniref:phage holin family protein n=1 Tax=Uliginosibacterium sp. sgz301328 TaxID=3243764 RepID=UPI00359D7807
MSSGLSARLRRISAHVVALGSSHLRLAGLEWQQQLRRQLSILVWLAAAIVCGGMTILLITLSIVAAYWDTPQRVTVVLALGAVFFVAALGIALAIRHVLHNAPVPFASLLEELRRDAEMLGDDDMLEDAPEDLAPPVVQEKP